METAGVEAAAPRQNRGIDKDALSQGQAVESKIA